MTEVVLFEESPSSSASPSEVPDSNLVVSRARNVTIVEMMQSPMQNRIVHLHIHNVWIG